MKYKLGMLFLNRNDLGKYYIITDIYGHEVEFCVADKDDSFAGRLDKEEIEGYYLLVTDIFTE